MLRKALCECPRDWCFIFSPERRKKKERKLNIINKAVIKLVFYDLAQSFGFGQ